MAWITSDGKDQSAVAEMGSAWKTDAIEGEGERCGFGEVDSDMGEAHDMCMADGREGSATADQQPEVAAEEDAVAEGDDTGCWEGGGLILG